MSSDFIIRDSDGFINITKLCKQAGKESKHWFATQKNKQLIEVFKKQNPGINPVDIRKGGNNKLQGTWAAPELAIHIASWISPTFAIKVGEWIKEWSNSREENLLEIKNFLLDIDDTTAYLNNDQEKIIAQKLALTLNGKLEVVTDFGRIDIMTDTEIIEVKDILKWKHAIGQIITYGVTKEGVGKIKRIHLFGESLRLSALINSAVEQLNIRVTYEKLSSI